jgi:hypothetical protein
MIVAITLFSPLPVRAQTSPVWKALHPAESLDLDADDDGDGFSNQKESITGTDPFNANDHFAVSSVQFHEEGTLLRWTAAIGRSYTIEQRANSEGSWEPIQTTALKGGGQRELLLQINGSGSDEYRLKIEPQNQAEEAALETLGAQDTDEDGQGDIIEYLAGTHPFDSNSTFGISEVGTGPFIELEWAGHEGKAYQVQYSQSLQEESWINLGEIRYGMEESMNTIFALSEIPGQFFRIMVTDLPSEIPGLSEWDAGRLGLDALERNEYSRNGLDLTEFLTRPDVIEIETPEPVANLSRNGVGMVEIRRTQGVHELTLPYTVGGTAISGVDYEALSGELKVPFGAKTALLPVTPLPSFQGTETKSVTLTFQVPSETGEGTVANTVTVNLMRESAINVIDYAAVGDGVTDDTAAIQAAIVALENSTTHNTLWFPAGTYRLSQLTTQPFTSGSYYLTLLLGSIDLTGRDLVFAGEPDSILMSKTGTDRSHILLTRARWRSLSFHNLTFQKDSQPLHLIQAGAEPNGAYGVAVAEYYGRSPERLAFKNCRFVNCHGAIRTFAAGSNIWGNLKQFSMVDCEVLNPYGSNTVEGAAAYGGGQQVNLTRWVGNAVYRQNLFIGGPDIVTDTTLNPDSVSKDGSHFGDPQRLTFSDNVVRNMGVEAVFQINDPLIGHSASSFVVPSANSGEVASMQLRQNNPTITAGQIVNFRSYSGGVVNCMLAVTAYDAATKTISIENNGASTVDISGRTINSGTPIFLQFSKPTLARIHNNIITSAPSGRGIGIIAKSRSIISGNFVSNHGTGINLPIEDKTPLSPPSDESVIQNNIVDWAIDSGVGYFSYGIQTSAKDLLIANNFVSSEFSRRGCGITVRGDGDLVINNDVGARNILRNGYEWPWRSVGIGIGNSSINAQLRDNSTHGFDIGVGPSQPYQAIPSWRPLQLHGRNPDRSAWGDYG